jgi:hypothetical protein
VIHNIRMLQEKIRGDTSEEATENETRECA